MAYASSLKEAISKKELEFTDELKKLAEKTIDEIQNYIEENSDFVKTNGIYAFSVLDVDLNGETSVNVEQAFSSESFSSIDYIVNHAKKDVLLTMEEFISKFDEAIEEHVEDFSEFRLYEGVLNYPTFWEPYVDSLIQKGFEVRIVNYCMKFSQSTRLGELPKEGFLIMFKLEND